MNNPPPKKKKISSSRSPLFHPPKPSPSSLAALAKSKAVRPLELSCKASALAASNMSLETADPAFTAERKRWGRGVLAPR